MCVFQIYKSFILNIKRVCMDNGRHTPGKEHSGQSNNERLNIQISDQKSLYKAESETDRQCDHDSHKYITALEIQIDRTAHAD